MKTIRTKKHIGVILAPSKRGFDAGASTFICAYKDQEDPDVTYIYYSGAKDRTWSHTAIGVAISDDGKHFRKLEKVNPLIDGGNRQFNSKESVTPAVVRISNYYYMFFAGSASPYRRKIGVAYAGDPRGPWEILKVIAKPEKYWEGWSIDLGPTVVKLGERDVLVFYSNVNNKSPFNLLFGPRYRRRSIGILKIKILGQKSVEALKYEGNPLTLLNGLKGKPNESLFCPGYLSINKKHFLLPTMSIYSIGFPYQQYIGLITGESPFFKCNKTISVLIDGPTEKTNILPEIKSEIALDTPSPIITEDVIYLYYSVMDRYDGVWKTALTAIDKNSFER
jgi:hypothetical protein